VAGQLGKPIQTFNLGRAADGREHSQAIKEKKKASASWIPRYNIERMRTLADSGENWRPGRVLQTPHNPTNPPLGLDVLKPKRGPPVSINNFLKKSHHRDPDILGRRIKR